jgi:hypothetical protein
MLFNNHGSVRKLLRDVGRLARTGAGGGSLADRFCAVDRLVFGEEIERHLSLIAESPLVGPPPSPRETSDTRSGREAP